jgi:hypothetical protein
MPNYTENEKLAITLFLSVLIAGLVMSMLGCGALDSVEQAADVITETVEDARPAIDKAVDIVEDVAEEIEAIEEPRDWFGVIGTVAAAVTAVAAAVGGETYRRKRKKKAKKKEAS